MACLLPSPDRRRPRVGSTGAYAPRSRTLPCIRIGAARTFIGTPAEVTRAPRPAGARAVPPSPRPRPPRVTKPSPVHAPPARGQPWTMDRGQPPVRLEPRGSKPPGYAKGSTVEAFCPSSWDSLAPSPRIPSPLLLTFEPPAWLASKPSRPPLRADARHLRRRRNHRTSRMNSHGARLRAATNAACRMLVDTPAVPRHPSFLFSPHPTSWRRKSKK